jgi:hypothetical protein
MWPGPQHAQRRANRSPRSQAGCGAAARFLLPEPSPNGLKNNADKPCKSRCLFPYLWQSLRKANMATSVLVNRTVEHRSQSQNGTLRKVKQALSELNKLGFDYRVAVNGRVAERVRRSTRTLESAPCRICGFRTVRPHDARAHRGQAKKAPFSRKELAERSMRRV